MCSEYYPGFWRVCFQCLSKPCLTTNGQQEASHVSQMRCMQKMQSSKSSLEHIHRSASCCTPHIRHSSVLNEMEQMTLHWQSFSWQLITFKVLQQVELEIEMERLTSNIQTPTQHSSTNLHSGGVLSTAGLELAMLCNWLDLQNHSADFLKSHMKAGTTQKQCVCILLGLPIRFPCVLPLLAFNLNSSEGPWGPDLG